MKSPLSLVAGSALLLAATAPAIPQNMESVRIAQELGAVIGSEDACGLNYNQAAIEQFVDDRVRDDDMGFTRNLNVFTQGAHFDIAEMSESSLTAHCRQIRRVARSFGFIEE